MRALVVVFYRSSILERFLPLPGMEVFFSFGDDLPDTDAFFWTSGLHATRIRRSGIEMPLIAPPDNWLSALPQEIKGRQVEACPLGELPSFDGEAFLKPAEVKIPALGAGFYTWRAFKDQASSAGLEDDDLVEVSFTRLDLDHEHRFMVADSEIVTGSPYRVGGEVYTEGMTSSKSADAQAFAQEVLGEVRNISPRAFSLDVGFDRMSSSWVCVEANPAWSSGPYGCERNAFMYAVENANTSSAGFDWGPSPWLVRKASMLPQVKLVPVSSSLRVT